MGSPRFIERPAHESLRSGKGGRGTRRDNADAESCFDHPALCVEAVDCHGQFERRSSRIGTLVEYLVEGAACLKGNDRKAHDVAEG